MTYQVTLPYPPSTNVYYRNYNGVTVLSAKAKLFKRDVFVAVHRLGFPPKLTGRLAIMLELHPPTKRNTDLDNRIKATQDALQDAGVFIDDSQVDDLRIVRREIVKGGLVVCTIKTIG